MKFETGNSYGYKKVEQYTLHRKPIAIRVSHQLRDVYETRTAKEIRSALEEIAVLKGWVTPEVLQQDSA